MAHLPENHRDYLRLCAEGLTSHEIAQLVGLSPVTVNKHLENALKLLNATNRAHAVAKAIRAGLI